jgi:hypothetical protein
MPYRIGHAQKALSLVLKHLWCHGLLPGGTMPPVCPIDRIMLTKVKANHGIAWTKIDTKDEYEAALGLIRVKAGSAPLAVFELFTYSGKSVKNDRNHIDEAQSAFLVNDRWAAPRGSSCDDIWKGALEDALRSSHARASLYRPGTHESAKTPFKRALRAELQEMGNAYILSDSALTRDQFMTDVMCLRNDMMSADMNSRFPSIF